MFKRSQAIALPLALGLLLSLEGAVMAQTYYVRPGDSLYTISNRFGTTPERLQSVNGLRSNYIYPGQSLSIPNGKKNSTSGTSSQYTVAPGDSLYLVAQKYGVTVDALRRANGLYSNQLYVGQTLTIPAGSSSGSFSGSAYTVQSNDSLYKIAQRYGVSMDSIRKANSLTSDQLYPGQVLTIPVGNTTDSNSGNVYRVQADDSLFKIAQRYGTTIDAIRKANGLTSNALMVGQVLQIPAATSNSGSGYIVSLTQSETDLLARLVTAESVGEPFEGQVAVAATVLNRLRDPRYPKTLYGVIYQVIDGVYYQYSPVLDGRINAPASTDAYRAVDLALKGWDPSNGAIGFYNPAKTSNGWVSSNPVTAAIGDHVFFKG